MLTNGTQRGLFGGRVFYWAVSFSYTPVAPQLEELAEAEVMSSGDLGVV